MHADRSENNRGIRRDWVLLWLVAIRHARISCASRASATLALGYRDPEWVAAGCINGQYLNPGLYL